jgi:hypothetical protein
MLPAVRPIFGGVPLKEHRVIRIVIRPVQEMSFTQRPAEKTEKKQAQIVGVELLCGTLRSLREIGDCDSQPRVGYRSSRRVFAHRHGCAGALWRFYRPDLAGRSASCEWNGNYSSLRWLLCEKHVQKQNHSNYGGQKDSHQTGSHDGSLHPTAAAPSAAPAAAPAKNSAGSSAPPPPGSPVPTKAQP